MRSITALACLAVLVACGEAPESAPESAPAEVAVPVPASVASDGAAVESQPASPFLATEDDDAGDPEAPRKHVRGTLALPNGAPLPAGTRVVGLRRVWLPGVATLRSGTWQRAPRAPVDAQGRFELAVPGHWNTLILYADAPVLLDDPLLRCGAVPPREEPQLIAKPCAALAGKLAPLVGSCVGTDAEELATLRVRGAFGERKLELAPGAPFEFARLPIGAELELALDASGYAPFAQPLVLEAAELRAVGEIGTPLARVRVEVRSELGVGVSGAACTIDGRTRATNGDGVACVPIGATPRQFAVTPPAGSSLLSLAGRATDRWKLALPAARTLRVRAREDARLRIAPRAADFEQLAFPVGAAFGARADANGMLEIPGLYPAPYTLELWSGATPDRPALRATLVHTPDDDELVAKLEPVASSRVELRVLTAERNPWPPYRVRFIDVEELALGLTDTLDGTGTDAALALPAGKWSVRVRDEKPGGPTAQIELELPRDAGRVHELVMAR